MSRPASDPGIQTVPCSRVSPAGVDRSNDAIVVEEPLELRVHGVACATLMRTPGSDRHLALGFYLTEGWIESIEQVGSLALCARSARLRTRDDAPGSIDENVVDLIPAQGVVLRTPDFEQIRRTPAVSSCGVCGKRTIEEVFALTPWRSSEGAASAARSKTGFPRDVVATAPDRLRVGQRLFEATGALHAAAIFDSGGRILTVEEDVGRHNAVDKVVGWSLLAGIVPLGGHGLVVSGRVSFEIVQKAHRAGLELIAAVSGVSSLAVELAERAGITLCGFVRGSALTVYAHGDRLRGSE